MSWCSCASVTEIIATQELQIQILNTLEKNLSDSLGIVSLYSTKPFSCFYLLEGLCVVCVLFFLFF